MAAMTERAAGHGDGGTPGFFGLDDNDNGVSDVFEALYPGLTGAHGDNDSDGQDNETEGLFGTNPLDSNSWLEFFSVQTLGATIQASWPTVLGKLYHFQSSADLASWANEGDPMPGTGGTLNGTCPVTSERMFLRLQVIDIDDDGDGLSDWEERFTGTDAGNYDSDGDGRADAAHVAGRLNLANVVTAFASVAQASEAGARRGRFTLVRRGNLAALTVGYTVSGTAGAGDYVIFGGAGSVSFAWGQTTATLEVIPTTDALVENAETVVLTLASGTGYSVGVPSAATVSIVDSNLGLTGNYYDGAETTYNDGSDPLNQNFRTFEFRRVDPTVDFNWGSGPPNPPAGVTMSSSAFSVRWTGSLVPTVTDTYTFRFLVDRGIKFWVKDGPIATANALNIDQWGPANNAVEQAGAAIRLEAGKRYNLRLDYRESATTSLAEAHFRWSRTGDPTVVTVPAAVLYSDVSPPQFSSPAYAVGIVGAPFYYQASASGGTVTGYAANGLPAGLSINGATGAITGTPNGPAGFFQSTVSATSASGTTAQNLSIILLPALPGQLTREVWTSGLTAGGVQSIPLHLAPQQTGSVSTFAAPSDAGDEFGERVRGYLTAPMSGNYTFFLTSDENAELWVSASPEPARRLKRSFVVNGAVPPGSWSTIPTQRSLSVRLRGGENYYIETIRRETTGSDHLAVGWLKPSDSPNGTPETMPSYCLSPWAAPATGTDGVLYIATMTPQSDEATNGSGAAVLRLTEEVGEAGTEYKATLTYSYDGLTGPITNQHVHDGRSAPGPVGAILFDLDAHPADSSGVYHWDIIATGNHTVADVLAAITSGNAYLNLHTGKNPSGEIKGFFQPAVGSQFFTPPAAPLSEAWPALTDAEAARFLMQAAFGPKYDADGAAPWDVDSIQAVKALGYSGWIDEQFLQSAGADPEILVTQELPEPEIWLPPAATAQDPYDPFHTIRNGSGPMATIVRNHYATYPRTGQNGTVDQTGNEMYRAWWNVVPNAADQLRHRVAFALSQILVVSIEGALADNARAISQYYDLLHYYALDNFRTILEKVTLNPAMGRYLDMLRNRKPDPNIGRIPNENYAREFMQLFSIGLRRLHPDGSLVLDSSGSIVATYDQDPVVGLAHVFTGWGYTGDNANFNSGSNYILPMAPFANQHDSGEKLLLDNTVIPAAPATMQSTIDELEASHDLIFHHPNTGPFICRQLIQRLVTANPTPAYIYRTSRVFDDNGNGVRGDMKAVVKAILLDHEARAQSPRTNNGYGHLREPIERVTAALRALRGYSAGSLYPDGLQLPMAVVATQTNIDLSQPLPSESVTTATPNYTRTVFDTIRLFPNQNVLVRAQTIQGENGHYTFQGDGLPLVRSTAADTAAELSGPKYCRVAWGASGGLTFRHDAVVTNLGIDPVLWVDNAGSNPQSRYWSMGSTDSALNQSPLAANTVFNFYEPNYIHPGATGEARLYGPEFQITNENSVFTTANLFYNLCHAGIGGNSDIKLEFSVRPTHANPYPWPLANPTVKNNPKDNPEIALANDNNALLDRLNILLFGGRLSSGVRSIVQAHLNSLPMRIGTTNENLDRYNRVKDAFILLTDSHEFNVAR